MILKSLVAGLIGISLLSGSCAADVISKQIQSSLVKLEGKKLEKWTGLPSDRIQYYALYFSAEWCPPCREFKPVLTKFYREMKPKYPSFEVILISRDETAKAMEDHLKMDQTPWPAIRFEEIASKSGILKYEGRGLPCLVLVDSQGKVLADSFVKNEYVGPESVLEALKKYLEPEKKNLKKGAK